MTFYTRDVVDRIRALAAERLPACCIAQQLGVSEVSLRKAACRFGISLRSTHARANVECKLGTELFEKLAHAAERRKMSAAELAETILAMVINHGLVKAVLDDNVSD